MIFGKFRFCTATLPCVIIIDFGKLKKIKLFSSFFCLNFLSIKSAMLILGVWKSEKMVLRYYKPKDTDLENIGDVIENYRKSAYGN